MQKKYIVIEGIEVNFDGALDNLKVDQVDPARYICVQEEKDIKTTEKLENNRELLVYRSTIEDDDNAKGVIESWREIHMFNDMAFRGAVCDKMNIRIRDIQKMQ